MNAHLGRPSLDATPSPPADIVRVGVPWARVELVVDWPRALDAHVLLAAVASEMQAQLGTLYHADWIGRDPDTGACIERRPVVRYDLSGARPVLWMDGPLAHDHAAVAARYLRALRLPAGQVREVREARMEIGEHRVGVHRRRLYRYRLVTPVFPSEAMRGRRPSSPWAVRAWAGEVLRTSIVATLESWGVTWSAATPPIVQVESGRPAPVIWRRPSSGQEVRGEGFTADFVSNVSFPPGAALGGKVREGWGRVEVLDSVEMR